MRRMAKVDGNVVGAIILLLFWTVKAAFADSGNVSTPSPSSAVDDVQAAPTFKVATTNQVVWKSEAAQNISINISRSSPSENDSVLKWCTHLLSSEDSIGSSTEIGCLSSSERLSAHNPRLAAAAGQITVKANDSSIKPIKFALDWETIRADEEYLIAARLFGLVNARVSSQNDVTMFVYGVSPGTCPPGTVNKNQHAQPPLTFHEPNATLQDLYLEVCPVSDGCTASPVSLQRKFLHPAFTPTALDYSALVPHGSSGATLVLRSLHDGDIVMFNASQCGALQTLNQTVSEKNQELRYNITPQLGNVCNLTISVFSQQTEDEDETIPQTALAAGGQPTTATVPAMQPVHKGVPQNFTVTLVQLLDPSELNIRSLWIANTTHTLVLCGNYTPRVLPFPPETVMTAEPFSNRCDEGTCFFVYGSQVPLGGTMALNATANLEAFVSAIPAPKSSSTRNASFERFSITLKSEDLNAYNLVSYRLLVINDTSDPDTNTEKLMCSTMTSGSSDVMPIVVSMDNTTIQSQSVLKKWLFATRDPDYPMHPAQDNSCLICPSGTHSARANAGACQYCPPGYYSNLSQWPAPLLSSCKACKPGTFSSWGASSCRRCWAGTYAPGNASTACQLCPVALSTRGDGAAACDISRTINPNIDYDAILLRFVVEFTGNFNLDQLPSVTGINSTGPQILSYLLRRDVAAWLNVSTDDVDASLPVAPARNLIKMDVAAKLQDESEAARSSKQLTSDEVVAGLSTGETMKYSGASQVNVRMLSKTELHRKKRKQMQQLHAILWPVLFVVAVLVSFTWWLCRKYLRRRNRKAPLQMQDTTGFIRWLNRDSVGHSSVSGGEVAPLDLEMPDFSVNSSTTPTPGGQRHRKQFIANYSSDESP